QVHAEHAELAQLGGELAREVRVGEPLRDVRPHAAVDELAHPVAHGQLGIAQLGVEVEQVGGRGHQSRPSALRTRATWPVARTLQRASATGRSGTTTTVERTTRT